MVTRVFISSAGSPPALAKVGGIVMGITQNGRKANVSQRCAESLNERGFVIGHSFPLTLRTANSASFCCRSREFKWCPAQGFLVTWQDDAGGDSGYYSVYCNNCADLSSYFSVIY